MILKENWEEKITSPEKVAKILYSIIGLEHKTDQDKEHFWVLGLNTNTTVKYIELVALGSLNACIAEPREIFRLAIMKGVASIIIAHNHPSGSLEFSSQDIEITKKLKGCGDIINIKVLDHVLIGKNGSTEYKSYKKTF